MKFSNPYIILGVKESATIDEIKHAYRELAKKYHSDISTGNEDKFIEVTWAYKFLLDADLRSHYDETGEIINSDKIKEDESKAKEVIISVFNATITTLEFIHNYKFRDLIKILKDRIKSKINEECRNLRERKEAIKFLSEIKKRIKTNNENFLVITIIEKIKDAVNLNVLSIKYIKTFNLALKLLDNFYYENDLNDIKNNRFSLNRINDKYKQYANSIKVQGLIE